MENAGDYPGVRALMTKASDDYRSVIGESALFDRLVAVSLEIIDLDEQKALAAKNGADPTPYLTKRAPLIQEVVTLVPHVQAEIQQAQRAADRRAENANALLGIFGGVAAGVIASEAARAPSQPIYQAPAYSSPTNCTVLPAGRNTVTGQSYGSHVHCR